MQQELKERLRKVVKKILGPKKERTNEFPTEDKRSGVFTGGSYFERYPDMAPVEDDGRAYTLGPTHQRPVNITAPSALGKSGPDLDKHMELHRDAVNVSANGHFSNLSCSNCCP